MNRSQSLKNMLQELATTSSLALPLVITALAQMSMELVDSLMMGMLGPDELAAGALAGSVFVITIVVGIGLLSSVGVYCARAYGASKPTDAVRVIQHGLILALLISLPAMLFIYWAPALLLWIHEPVNVVANTQAYLYGIVYGIIPLFGYVALREFTAAFTHTRIILIANLCAVPLNVIGNYVLMYGKLGLPALGIQGIGLASAMVEWMLFISLIVYVVNAKDMRKLKVFHWLKPTWIHLRSLLTLGWPVAVFMGLEVGMFSVSALLIGYFGATQLAAHQIALQLSAFAFMIPLGISQATAIRVGHNMGAGSVQGAKTAGWVGICLGLMAATVMAGIFLGFARDIVELFLNEDLPHTQQALALAKHFLYVAVVFQWFDAVQVIATGALRGLKDTLVPMVLGLLSYWLAGLGVGVSLGFWLQWQGIGIWWGLAVGITFSAILMQWRFIANINKRMAYKSGQNSC